MKFFYFCARNISYTFAISLFSVFISLFIILFGFFLGSAFIFFSNDRLISMILKYLPLSVLISSGIYFIWFGFFSPIKIPAFFRSLRFINKAFKNDYNISDNELPTLYRNFSDLPMLNLVYSAFYCSIMGILVVVLAYYEYTTLGVLTIAEIKGLSKVVVLSTFIVLILNGMAVYLLAEALTDKERSLIYNLLIEKKLTIRPMVLIGLRVKFLFFVMLMIITLLSFAAFMEKMRFDDEYKIGVIAFYFLVSIFAGLSLMQINTRSILRILKDIRRVSAEIASGGKASFEVIALDREFAAIEYAMMEMSWEIDEHRKNLEDKVQQRTVELQSALSDLKLRDDQMQKQLDMASVIQRSILPGKINDWNELKFSVRYNAMEKIGGDFYDIYQLKDDKIGVMIADVSGHGIPAALVTTMAKISFGNAGAIYDSPRRIFQEVNQNILDHVKTQDYMTCFMVAIDDEYNVVYSNASHQKAVLVRTMEGGIELLDTGGLFIGAIEEARDSYDETTTKLEYGDRIVLYTDGIPEATNANRREYSNKRFENIILENRHLPLEEFSDKIINDVQLHIGNSQVEDDITLLVIELVEDEAIATIREAKRLLNTHKYYEAINVLEMGLEKYPENQKIVYNLAKNYFRVNNYLKAVQNVESYIKNDRRNKFAFYIGGASHYQMEEYEKALNYYLNAIELDSNFVDALFALGMTYKKMDNLSEAIKTFEKVVNIDPDNKMALFELRNLKAV